MVNRDGSTLTIDELPRDKPVVFDWRPLNRTDGNGDELAERYVIFDDPKALGGVILFGFFCGRWIANPGERHVMRELLKRSGSIN